MKNIEDEESVLIYPVDSSETQDKNQFLLIKRNGLDVRAGSRFMNRMLLLLLRLADSTGEGISFENRISVYSMFC